MARSDYSPPSARVLIVDDEPLTRRALGRLLPPEEFVVSFAEDGESALSAMMTGSFDVVVADVQMPGLNGLEMLRHVRDHDEQLPVVFVTGSPSVDMAAQAVELGAFRYLVKPVQGEMFCAVLRGAVRKRSKVGQGRRRNLISFGNVPQTSTSKRSERSAFDLFVTLGQGCRRMALTTLEDGKVMPFVRLATPLLVDCCETPPSWLSKVVIEMSASEGVLTNARLRGCWNELRRQKVPLALADHIGDIVDLAELGSLTPNYVVLSDALLPALETDEEKQGAIIRILDVCRLIRATVVIPCFDDPSTVPTLKLLDCEIYQNCVITRSHGLAHT